MVSTSGKVERRGVATEGVSKGEIKGKSRREGESGIEVCLPGVGDYDVCSL